MMDKVWKRRERREEWRREEKGREEIRREEKRWLSAYLIFHAKQTLGIVSEFNFYGSGGLKSSRLIPIMM